MAYPTVTAADLQGGQTWLPAAADWRILCQDLDDWPAKHALQVISATRTDSGQIDVICADFPDPGVRTFNCSPERKMTVVPSSTDS